MSKVKGIKDYAGKEALKLRKIVETIRKYFRLYGFQELVTGCLEKREVLQTKDTSEEIISDTFKLEDRGKRKLGLRYELTVTLARFLKENQVKLPFKRFEIGEVWRDEPTKPGRYREFLQADADVVGSASILADAECLLLTKDIFKELGIKIEILVNSRKLLNGILEYLDIKEKEKVLVEIDKISKKGREEVKKELSRVIGMEKTKKLFSILERNLKEIEKINNKNVQQGVKEIKELIRLTKAKFSPFLARGLAYYTGNVFEVYSKDFKFALAAGGRFDRKIIIQGRKIPSVGISFGINRIVEIYKKEEAFADVLIIQIGEEREKAEALKLAEKLRKKEIKIDLAYEGITKALNYANSLAIPFVIFLGKKELEKKKIKLRDMKTGKEQLLNEKQIIEKLKNNF